MNKVYIFEVVKQQRSIPVMHSVLAEVADRLMDGDETLIRIPEICEATGVNYGSVYHHFGSREGVIEAAYEMIFARLVNEDIDTLHEVSLTARTFQEYEIAMLPLIGLMMSGEERHVRRAMRLRIVAASQTRPALREMIGETQEHLSDELTKVVEFGQGRGWLRTDMSPKAIAAVVQALIFGRNLEDVSNAPLSEEEWTHAMAVLVSELLVRPPTDAS